MTEHALLEACRTLFGKDVNLNREFLSYLQPSGVKLAFRSQVKVNHPDRFNDSPQHVRLQQTERFREIHQAYSLLKEFFDQKRPIRPDPLRQNGRPARRSASSYTPPCRTGARSGNGKPAHARGSRFGRPGRTTRPPAPAIPLEFGMYAYYQGRVTYRDLIEALVWQRRQRPTLGAIAMKWGWLSDAEILRILRYRGHAQRFGKKAVELGLLSQHQVDTLVRHQRTLQRRLGQYFVEKGLMSEQEADVLAGQLNSHNVQVNNRSRSRQA